MLVVVTSAGGGPWWGCNPNRKSWANLPRRRRRRDGDANKICGASHGKWDLASLDRVGSVGPA